MYTVEPLDIQFPVAYIFHKMKPNKPNENQWYAQLYLSAGRCVKGQHIYRCAVKLMWNVALMLPVAIYTRELMNACPCTRLCNEMTCIECWHSPQIKQYGNRIT